MKPCLSSLTVCGPIGALNAFIVHVESAYGAGWGFWQLLGVWYIFSEERLLATTRRRLNKHSDRDPHLAWGGRLRKVTDSVDHETEKRTGGVNEGGVQRTVKVLCLRFHPNPRWNQSAFMPLLSQLGGEWRCTTFVCVSSGKQICC